jgi:hypothetical protein
LFQVFGHGQLLNLRASLFKKNAGISGAVLQGISHQDLNRVLRDAGLVQATVVALFRRTPLLHSPWITPRLMPMNSRADSIKRLAIFSSEIFCTR